MRTSLILGLVLLCATSGSAEPPPVQLYAVQLCVREQESKAVITRPTLVMEAETSASMAVGQTIKIDGRDEFVGFEASALVQSVAGRCLLNLKADMPRVVLQKDGHDGIERSPGEWIRVLQPGETTRIVWKPRTGPALVIEATVKSWHR